MEKIKPVLVLGCLVGLSFMMISQYIYRYKSNIYTVIQKTPPIIFFYEKHPSDWFPVFNLSQYCPNYCIFTENMEMYNKSSAVIFFRTLRKPPPPKLKKQIWIFLTFESPRRTWLPGKISPWRQTLHQFDSVMSYRPSSDIHVPFGIIKKSSEDFVSKLNLSHIYFIKDREVAWLVSHCDTLSRREHYVRELQKYIPVDIYGFCGDKKCPIISVKNTSRVESITACKTYLSKRYKFYLAFENSICEHYTTEKVFGLYESYNFMVPVVRGDPKVSKYLPKGTFISAYNFTSPKRLGKYLKKVGSSEDKYNSYLREKIKYNVTSWTENYEQSICELCTKLTIANGKLSREKDFNLKERLYSDKCYNPFDIM